MAVPQVRKEWDDLATKGREYGVSTVRAAQRGTTDRWRFELRFALLTLPFILIGSFAPLSSDSNGPAIGLPRNEFFQTARTRSTTFCG